MAEQELVNLNTIQADLIIQTLKSLGVQDFHSSPGLRNAPLLDAIAKDKALNLYSHFDERANAYRALAQAKRDGNMTAILCTSGTAVANFMPAVIEAFFQEIPLLILTSDRPHFAIEGLANQSIYQNKIFGEYAPLFERIHEPSTKLNISELHQSISRNIQKALKQSCPVHLNISFLDPANINENSVSKDKAIHLIDELHSLNYLNEGFIQPALLTSQYSDYSKLAQPDLIAIGELPLEIDNEIKEELIHLLKTSSVPFTVDITSQIKYQTLDAPYCIPSIDHPEVKQWLSQKELKNVWHIGNRLTSKRYYQLLKEQNSKVYNFSNSRHNFNPSLNAKEQFPLSVNAIKTLKELLDKKTEAPKFDEIIEAKRSIIEENPLSFPYISKKIIEEHLCDDDLLVLANSTCIRSFDFYASTERKQSPDIYCHRGASGIEGFFASLVGLNDSSNISKNKKIVAILGDITALHDFNSLFLMQSLTPQIQMDVFLVNDAGGGIFRLLNVPEMQSCKNEMETPHKTQFNTVLQAIFKNSPKVNIQQILTKDELLNTIQRQNVIREKCINFYEIVLNQDENNKVYQCLRTISSNNKS